MSKTYSSMLGITKSTPQSMPIPGKEAVMAKNNAGGYAFKLPPLAHLTRFLILGVDSPTYYVSQKDLATTNLTMLHALFDGSEGEDAVREVIRVATQGLAPRPSPLLAALAIAASCNNREVRKLALHPETLRAVIRTNAQMLEFAGYLDSMRGWGRLVKQGVAAWYNTMPTDRLMYQITKYRQRGNWATGDVFRKVRPNPPDANHSYLYEWATSQYDKETTVARAHGAVDFGVVEYLDLIGSPAITPEDITRYNFTWEHLPTELLRSVKIWEALLPHMPMGALMRNLGRLGNLEMLKPMSAMARQVIKLLTNEEKIAKSRIHPFNVLNALVTYKSGKGFRGSMTWNVNGQVVDALEQALQTSFRVVPPSTARTVIGIDVSYSMCGKLYNSALSAHEGAAVMALVTARSCGEFFLHGFTSRFEPLGIRKTSSFSEAMRATQRSNFGSTDCAVPMLYATKNKLDVDTFVVYTDNETWAGSMHPVQALDQYQQSSGHAAKLIVVGMTSTGFTIADPARKDMLDVVGFDASAPQVISRFSNDALY